MGGMGGMPSHAAPQPAPTPAPPKPKEWTPAQYGGYVPPADGKGGGQVLIKSVNGKVVITPVPGTGATVPTTTISSTTNKKQTTSTAPTPQTTKVTQAPASGGKKPLGPAVSRATPSTTSAPPTTRPPAPLVNGVVEHGSINGNKNNMMGNNNIENQAPNEEASFNGNIANGDDESKRNKKNKKKRNPDEKLEEINSIFAPREVDCGGVDAADREIEQFKQFCRDSVPAQNRAKVNFDVRNIAFKKK